MKLLKYILLLIAIYSYSAELVAQYEYPGSEEESTSKRRGRSEDSRWFFGGNFALWFAQDFGYVELSPLAGYKLTQRLSVGAGPKYMYLKSGDYNNNIYGLKTFASFSVLDRINETTNLGIGSVLLYIENEVLSYKQIALDGFGRYYIKDRNWYNLARAGVGIRIPAGQRAGISLLILWGLTPTVDDLYSNPDVVFSVYF